MYKEFTKSAGDTWDDIARRAYGTPEKGGDIAKMNNNIEAGSVLVLEEDETGSDDVKATGEIYLRYGDTDYNDFSECSLYDGMEAVKGASFVFNITDLDYDFNFNDSVVVCDEQGLFLKGRVANIKSSLTNYANWVQIEVKSHAGVLTETVMPNPFEFSDRSIKGVLEQVAGYYNQKIDFSGEAELEEVFTNEIGTSFTAEKSETVWEFMRRICRSRGLLLTDTGDGLFIGRYKPETEEKLNLIDGECLGVREIRAEFITVGLGRYYEVNSQYPSTDSAIVQIPLPIPVTKRYDSNDFNSMSLEDTARRIACSEIGQHFKVYAELSENLRKKSGDFVVLKNSKIKINNETDFIIEEIERRHPDVTLITLTLPCAYTYEIPESLPLCN